MPLSVAGLIAAEKSHSLPVSSIAVYLLALLIFGVLLAVTWAFRGSANKYTPPQEHDDGSTHH